jgi:hypothetical protein
MQWSAFVVLLILMLLGGVAESQNSQTNQNDLAQRVQHLMDIEVGFEQMVPSGMSIEAKEVSRKGNSGKDLVVQYHIFATGVPPDTLFKFIDWPVNADKPSARLEGVSVGKDGILMCAGRTPEQCGDPKKPDDPIEFTFMPTKGEPSRLVFVSSNVRIGTVIVPDPIEAKDKACTLRAIRLTRTFDLAFLSGTGYPPNTDVHYTVSSEMTSNLVIKSDSNGTIRVSVVPYPGKKKQGTASVKITEAKCSPQVSWEWGPI